MENSNIEIFNPDNIRSRIYTIRDTQIMLDSDLAELYGVETKVLNQAVKRNIDRFPEEFCFQLTKSEYEFLKSQIVTLDNNALNLKSQIVISSSHGGVRKLPYVFTEQGVTMLSAVLRSETAVKMSIKIVNAFVTMRKFLSNNGHLFQRLETIEKKQLKHEIETDKKFDQIFNALESGDIKPKQGIFFDGQVFDAYQFVSDLFRTAQKSIVIIDNYIDDTVLTHLSKRKKSVKVTIFTKAISKQLALDIRKYNEQYQPVLVKEFNNSHDRFLIIDDKTVYHFGASLKDLGKKWFAFSKFDKEALNILGRLAAGDE